MRNLHPSLDIRRVDLRTYIESFMTIFGQCINVLNCKADYPKPSEVLYNNRRISEVLRILDAHYVGSSSNIYQTCSSYIAMLSYTSHAVFENSGKVQVYVCRMRCGIFYLTTLSYNNCT